jgi:hypothetical protein
MRFALYGFTLAPFVFFSSWVPDYFWVFRFFALLVVFLVERKTVRERGCVG